MWIITAHQPSGTTIERFHTADEAKASLERFLAQGVPVTLDPAGKGLPSPRGCSFCGKPRDQVRYMCAGPAGAGVAICNAWVDLASALFREEATSVT